MNLQNQHYTDTRRTAPPKTGGWG